MSTLVMLSWHVNALSTDEPAYAVVADDAHYAFVFAQDSEMAGELNERAENDKKRYTAVRSAEQWLRIATSNSTFMQFTGPTVLDSYDAGVQRAKDLLAAYAGTDEQEQDS